MGKKSRDKGNRGERQAMKLLSQIWGGEFRRSGSGFDGDDMVTVPDDFPWSVEVKDRADILARHLWNPNARLRDCLDQAFRNAMGRPWMLVIKIERKWFVLTAEDKTAFWVKRPFLSTEDYIAYPIENLAGLKGNISE